MYGNVLISCVKSAENEITVVDFIFYYFSYYYYYYYYYYLL
jgi:hypothetical protein